MTDAADAAIRKLLAYCQANDWAGYDPYDALNSKLFDTLPFLKSRLPRIVTTQVLKNSPINIRSLALVPKTQNPKAISLFLSGLLNLSKIETNNREDLVEQMIERLIALRSPSRSLLVLGIQLSVADAHRVSPRRGGQLGLHDVRGQLPSGCL